MNQQTKAVEVSGLTKLFGALTAVDHISFDVSAGEIFGFLGPNGAGKTTLIRMLTTLLKPSFGRARVRRIDERSGRAQIRSGAPWIAVLVAQLLELGHRLGIDPFSLCVDDLVGRAIRVPRSHRCARGRQRQSKQSDEQHD